MNEGKWYFDDEDGTVSVIKDGEALEVCTVCTFDQDGARWIFGEKTKAHAALLTSAPALLEALEELLYGTFPDGVDDDGSGRIVFSDACVKRYNKARAAIAAARGTV